jgi:type I restriction enzyme, S subunit
LVGKDRDSTGKVPVYGSSGQVGWHSEALAQMPTIIIGRKGTVGSVYYSPVPCWAIDTTYYFELDNKNINLLYFYYLLTSIDLSHQDNSSIIPGLNRNNYNAINVSIAPLAEQQRIVNEIEKQLSRLDETVKSLMRT